MPNFHMCGYAAEEEWSAAVEFVASFPYAVPRLREGGVMIFPCIIIPERSISNGSSSSRDGYIIYKYVIRM